jgi:UDP-N-acetyl-D-mannosaminuronic acid dehydrogenase
MTLESPVNKVSSRTDTDVVIVGGCGRVGLPLGVALAAHGLLSVTLYDIDAAAVDTVNRGQLPFSERGAAEPLREAVRDGLLRATTDGASVATTENLIVVVGTPVDEHLNPDLGAVPRALERCAEHL